MRSRSFRSIAVLVSVLLLANTTVQAGPVTLRDVMQVVGNYQNPPDLRIRGVSQTQGNSSSNSKTNTLSNDTFQIVDTSVAGSNADSLLSGVVLETSQDPVKIVVPGDVEVAVCDCGVLTMGTGFPKWPLLFLAAIPLFFIKDDECDDCDEVTPTPTPTPTPTTTPETPVPEPASLLLFGSGLAALGASLRRRRMKAKLESQCNTTEEG